VNIIDRNFYRLLRAGAFNTEEMIEPLSVWKWKRLYQLSQMHDVAPFIYKGITRFQDQFFVQIPEELMKQWAVSVSHVDMVIAMSQDKNDLLASDHLTNPLLNHILQNILDSEDSNAETRKMLLHLLGIGRFVMNAGIPVKRVVELGIFLRSLEAKRIDFSQLDSWISLLKLGAMTQVIAVMLVKLLDFKQEELPFMKSIEDGKMERLIEEIFLQRNSHPEDWYFQQGKDIFVHTSNSQAMLWHVRRSIKFFKYYPSETFTNFFASFAHSLSHIEE
jgi:hypothetical protein